MAENEPDIRTTWQTQTAEVASLAEIQSTVERREKCMLRGRIVFIIALVLLTIFIAGLAVLFLHPLLTAGAVVSIAGFALLAYEMNRYQRRQPVAENGNTTSVEYHRVLLQHRVEFHRRRLWLRVASVTPGGILFLLGLAAARPDLAPIIYVELATFVLIVSLIVPGNLRAAAKLEREIAALDQMREG